MKKTLGKSQLFASLQTWWNSITLSKSFQIRQSIGIMFIIGLTILFQACIKDGVYMVRGTTFAPLSDLSNELSKVTDKENLKKVSDVEVEIFLSEKSRETNIPDARVSDTDSEGQFRLYYYFETAKFTEETFLEFNKPGYQTKRVYFMRMKNDSTAEVKPCEDIKKGCWLVNVLLVPSATNEKGSDLRN